MKKAIVYLAFLTLIQGTSLLAFENPAHEPYVGSEAFEKLKTLAGTWKGTSVMKEETKEATVHYKVTSAGSAVVETLFPGTPEEMVSVYSEQKGEMVMTHYCGFKNQPTLKLKDPQGTKELSFDFIPSGGINPGTDSHMHSLVILIESDNAIQHEWTMYLDGQPAGSTVIRLNRTD